MPYSLDQFQYDLPKNLIAQQPLASRHHSRMMLLTRGHGAAAHHHFHELPGLLPANALLVVNNTRVLPRRVTAVLKGGARVEALLVEELAPGEWRAMVKRARRIKVGETVPFGDGHLPALALRRDEEGGWIFRFDEPATLPGRLEQHGFAPLPPYIRRGRDLPAQDQLDKSAYQTCYASIPGAIAAPTAGLHFVAEVLEQIRERGIGIVELTLHVGLGTFTSVKEENLDLHKMHGEWYELPKDTAQQILQARAEGRPVIAVGTTTVRALESWAQDDSALEGSALEGSELTGRAQGHSGWAHMFIRPPYSFRVVEGLITNFHQPGSTLLMLVAAFQGLEPLLEAYREAVETNYRFFSYGDCMAILPGLARI